MFIVARYPTLRDNFGHASQAKSLGTSWGRESDLRRWREHDLRPRPAAPRPAIIRSSVVLPEPFRPSSPIRCPGSIWQVTLSSSCRPAESNNAQIADRDESGMKSYSLSENGPRGRKREKRFV